MFVVSYDLGFYISESGIPHSRCSENLNEMKTENGAGRGKGNLRDTSVHGGN
jgi:hypothetical protein